jgi:hypothetical protein
MDMGFVVMGFVVMGFVVMGFVVMGFFARHCRPRIRFLFIGSHLCSALLSGPASRRV